MKKNLEKYLIKAANAAKEELPSDNPYRDIGFDGEKGRLGWARTIPFSRIKSSLERVLPLLAGKKNFIFVGMGGSINGIKPLLILFKKKTVFTIDSLDPGAIAEVIGSIEDLEGTMVIPISKTGTTKETQLLSLTLREVFSNRLGENSWARHFLWLSDPGSFPKLNSLGWEGVEKRAIQFDCKEDIGGRFSSPHTMMFLLPLLLLLDKNFSTLRDCYNSFIKLRSRIHRQAYLAYQECRDRPQAYFSPLITGGLGQSSSWIVQLFQESLGSKSRDLSVKTLINTGGVKRFFPLSLFF